MGQTTSPQCQAVISVDNRHGYCMLGPTFIYFISYPYQPIYFKFSRNEMIWLRLYILEATCSGCIYFKRGTMGYSWPQ